MTHPLKHHAVKHAQDPTPQEAEAERCVVCDCLIILAFGALLAGALVIML